MGTVLLFVAVFAAGVFMSDHTKRAVKGAFSKAKSVFSRK